MGGRAANGDANRLNALTPIAAKLGGYTREVHFRDFAHVRAGQILNRSMTTPGGRAGSDEGAGNTTAQTVAQMFVTLAALSLGASSGRAALLPPLTICAWDRRRWGIELLF